MTILELFNNSSNKPIFIFKGTQYLLVQSILDNNQALGINMQAYAEGEGYQGLGYWAVVDANSTGWTLVG